MYILFPGRHHLLTNFQFNYLSTIIHSGIYTVTDINGENITSDEPIDAIIYAVTSANHSNTRRNPLPFHLRAMQLQKFSDQLNIPFYIYGIDDVGTIDDFAEYTIKRIKHESDNAIHITPENTCVLCSTPVLEMYDALGFTILPAELENRHNHIHNEVMPWEVVEKIADTDVQWSNNIIVKTNMHQASLDLWHTYGLWKKVQMLFSDTMIGADGDITGTRDYNSYVRQMDENVELKYKETAFAIQPGRIGDIGCAVGSWIKCAAEDPRLHESDFYGIEVTRHLYDICIQRKHNGAFASPYVFFAQKNAVTGLVFEEGSMDSIHTSSLTHEILSYGNSDELRQFIRNRYQELAPGGVWVNRDVIGPGKKDRQILMLLNKTDGRNDDYATQFDDREKLDHYLAGLSTYARFFRFAQDFRKNEHEKITYTLIAINDIEYISLSLQHACEFMWHKDYTGNWQSEMHESFCFWSYADWEKAVLDTGFRINERSVTYSNEWIIDNRLVDKVALFTRENDTVVPLNYPVSHMVLIAMKH